MTVHPDEVVAWTVTAAVVTVLVTAPLIRWLERLQFGKTLRREFGVLLMPPKHAKKEGVPTMGGLGMLAVIGLFGSALISRESFGPAFVLGVGGCFALLGLLDDLVGLGKIPGFRAKGAAASEGLGLSAKAMFAAQVAVAAVAGAWWSDELPLAFLEGVPAGAAAAAALTAIVVVGTANGVNLADGLDGLAGGLLAVSFAAVGALGWLVGESTATSALCFVAAGACIGFLVFNRHPARVIMGGVASMGMGATLGAAALANGTWPLLPIIGVVFVAESLSVILQVSYFKSTGGQRLFRMAPLHHHYELAGWTERDVVRRFWLAGVVAAVAALAIGIPLSRLN